MRGLLTLKRGFTMDGKEGDEPVTKEPTQAGGKEGQEPSTKEPPKEPMYTQAELDQRITDAGIKNEKRMIEAMELKEAQAEQERLEEAGKYEELYHSNRSEIDALKAKNKASQFKMDAQKALNNLGLVNHDSLIGDTESIETVIARAEQYQRDVSAAVEDGIRERLGTGVNHVPTQNTNTSDKTPDNMNHDEYHEWLKSKGLTSRYG